MEIPQIWAEHLTDDVILENLLSLQAAITSSFPIFHRLLGYEAELLSNNINLSIKSSLIRSKIDVKNDSSIRHLFLIRRFILRS